MLPELPPQRQQIVGRPPPAPPRMPTWHSPSPARASPTAWAHCTPPAPGKQAHQHAALGQAPTVHSRTPGSRTPRASHGRSRPPRPQAAGPRGPRLPGGYRPTPRTTPAPGLLDPKQRPRPAAPGPARGQQQLPKPSWKGSGRRTCWRPGAGLRRRRPRRRSARTRETRRRACRPPRLQCSLPAASTAPGTPPRTPKLSPFCPLPARSPAPTTPLQPLARFLSARADTTPAAERNRPDHGPSAWTPRGARRLAGGERCWQRRRSRARRGLQ
mmetsp:Transcript_68723/g.183099  ORF Transcript_68723/g.183099 Transcript_68723/m.183099 type:complete len:271 (-) Transcript_68723:142-954(-)